MKDAMIDFLNETKLFEMAFERKIAIQKARNLRNQSSRHLIKISMYSDSEYVNHWFNELNSWLWDIQDNILKNTKKSLDYPTLMKILFEEPMETVDEVQYKMNQIYREYKDLKIYEPNSAEIHKHLYLIINAMCKDISDNNFEDIKRYFEIKE